MEHRRGARWEHHTHEDLRCTGTIGCYRRRGQDDLARIAQNSALLFSWPARDTSALVRRLTVWPRHHLYEALDDRNHPQRPTCCSIVCALGGAALVLAGVVLIALADLDRVRKSELTAVKQSIRDWNHEYKDDWLAAQVRTCTR
jgi:hypothetical protein